MNQFTNELPRRNVYPIKIKNNGVTYLTLFYYTDFADEVLHTKKSFLYFETEERMLKFCEENSLALMDESAEYDFDAPVEFSIDCNDILEKWNLLDTLSESAGMRFAGKKRKYDPLYDALFACCFPTERTDPPHILTVTKKQHSLICKILKAKDRILRKSEKII